MNIERSNRAVKNILIIIRLKSSMIIKLLLMIYAVCARLEISDIKKIGKTVIIKEGGLLIHPDGPLSPLRGYIMHRSEYMHNKRFYSPEINTEYSLTQKNKLTEDGEIIYKYTREPVKDKVYKDIFEDEKKNNYIIQFHKQLIRMFPSADGSLSIVTGRSDALYSFLIKNEVRPYSMYILAAIFLLSEKVNISIIEEVEKGKKRRLIVKSNDGKMVYIDPKECNKETINLIEFLKKYIDNGNANPNSIERFPAEPTTYEQFKTGEFLNTKQFLVQSYVYEFIDTPEKYIEFVEAVHALLREQIKNEKSTPENKTKSIEVLKKYFIEEKALLSVANHVNAISDLKETKDKSRVCPFVCIPELPTYTRVKAYDRTNDKELDDEDEKYSNCVEASILGLVCCLMYDPNTKKYTTDHLPDNKETKPLKKFFKKYPKPTESTTYEMQQDWCRVVADLKNAKIFYVGERNNELDSSLINILYVISDITGNKKEVLREIELLRESYSLKEAGTQINVQKSLIKIFTEASNNKSLKVVCDKFVLDNRRKDKRLDLFGEFNLFYSFKEMEIGITMDIGRYHAKLGLAEDLLFHKNKADIEEKLTEIQSLYKTPKNYIECIIKHYIDIEIVKMKAEDIYMENPISYITLNSINTGGYRNVLTIFLYGRIETIDYKDYIVSHFLMFYVTKPQSDKSLIRMTNNIIGSVSLNDQHTRNWILQGYIYNPEAKNYYTKIDKSAWDSIFIDNDSDTFSLLSSILFLASHYIENDFKICFTRLMNAVNKCKDIYDIIINDYYMINNILYYLDYTTKSKIDTFCEIMNILEESLKELDKQKLTNIYLAWFFDICSMNRRKSAYLLCLFNIIDNNYITTVDKEDIQWSIKDSSIILDCLQNNRNIFCYNDPRRIDKFNKIIQLLKDSTVQEQTL
ncbi:hypothetical protein NEIRO03_0609 [Nematocida sp. AWRm78]|nr:hypothetical protein NEIRO02_0526 [Nematocida sp. AWRm79]KAI5182974.1 hypothetical protein NEIRO03_0609 [Nematocida sp. AWRm78]